MIDFQHSPLQLVAFHGVSIIPHCLNPKLWVCSPFLNALPLFQISMKCCFSSPVHKEHPHAKRLCVRLSSLNEKTGHHALV